MPAPVGWWKPAHAGVGAPLRSPAAPREGRSPLGPTRPHPDAGVRAAGHTDPRGRFPERQPRRRRGFRAAPSGPLRPQQRRFVRGAAGLGLREAPVPPARPPPPRAPGRPAFRPPVGGSRQPRPSRRPLGPHDPTRAPPGASPRRRPLAGLGARPQVAGTGTLGHGAHLQKRPPRAAPRPKRAGCARADAPAWIAAPRSRHGGRGHPGSGQAPPPPGQAPAPARAGPAPSWPDRSPRPTRPRPAPAPAHSSVRPCPHPDPAQPMQDRPPTPAASRLLPPASARPGLEPFSCARPGGGCATASVQAGAAWPGIGVIK